MNDWQHNDWLFVDKHDKSCIVRSRGGSKTKDFSNWIVFRVLRTGELWGWYACKSGQLNQALGYFRENPFVKIIKPPSPTDRRTWHEVILLDGQTIRVGIISNSNLGGRLDGILYDEFEDMESNQEFNIYPTMKGMQAVSDCSKTIYLGTLWISCKLNEFFQKYPSSLTPWYKIDYIVRAGAVKKVIDDPLIPEWEKDMLYRCIPATPSGKLFNNVIIIEDHPELEYIWKPVFNFRKAEQFGLDFGSIDRCAGTLTINNNNYILEEREVVLEEYPDALDDLKGQKVQSESGGYNDMDKYKAKNKLMIQRIGSTPCRPTVQWKASIQMYARGFGFIFISRNRTPNILADINKACFGLDGLYKKNKTDYQDHWLECWFHSLKADKDIYLDGGNSNTRNSDIVRREKERQLRKERGY